MRKDWVEVELDYACKIYDNLRKPINSQERAARIAGKNPKELFPYYGATGQVGFIDDYLSDGEYILIGEDGAPFLDYNKDVAYLINGKCWVNNHAHILLSNFNNKFLLYYLNQVNLKDFVSGTTRLKLTQSSLKQIPVKIAPLPEQRAIVSKIELLFSELDNAVSNLKQAKDKLEIFRQSVLKKAFEGKWNSVELNKICDKIQDGSHFSPQNQILYKKDGFYPYITSKNIRNNYLDLKNVAYVDSEFHESIYKRCNPEFGDVLLTKDGVNTGNVCINTLTVPFSLLSSVCLLKPNRKLMDNHFLSYYIQSPTGFRKIIGKMTGTAIKRIILKKIKEATIPLPPLKEQQEIVQEIETRFSVADKLAESIDESLLKAEALRQSILKKAFDGELLSKAELDACRKESDWEPADKLLERIKRERK